MATTTEELNQLRQQKLEQPGKPNMGTTTTTTTSKFGTLSEQEKKITEYANNR